MQDHRLLSIFILRVKTAAGFLKRFIKRLSELLNNFIEVGKNFG
jgi:hypothetical protein